MNTLNFNNKYQSGQAITEFNVTAAFVLVPLFIMIPLLGKHIDMKHSSVQAARYMAWERTVWFEDKTIPKYSTTAQVKSQRQLEKETRQRFFGEVTIDKLGSDTINPLWNDRGNSIIKSQDDVALEFLNGGNEAVLNKNNKTSIFYKAIETFSEGVGIAANLAGTALSLGIQAFNFIASKVGFPSLPVPPLPDVIDKFQFKGYYRSNVKMNIDSNQYESVFGISSVPIESHASVLTDGWVIQGDKQFSEWTKSFVPFSPLKPLFEPIKRVATFEVLGIALAPEFKDLNFGYVDTDPMSDSSIAITDNLKDKYCPDGLCSLDKYDEP